MGWHSWGGKKKTVYVENLKKKWSKPTGSDHFFLGHKD
jgi:hypothetical protein